MSAELRAGWSSSYVRTPDGTRLHVVSAGPPEGPPIILLHGFPEFWWGWRHQITPLANAGFRVIVPDQRGYAASDAPPELGPTSWTSSLLTSSRLQTRAMPRALISLVTIGAASSLGPSSPGTAAGSNDYRSSTRLISTSSQA